LRTALNVLLDRKRRFGANKKVYPAIGIVMFVLWFSMNFSDPIGMSIPLWVRYAGLVLSIGGACLFVLSHKQMRGFSDKGHLVTEGVYSRIRHPTYPGFILALIGFPVFMQNLLTLASGLIWVPHILYWKLLEERELEKKYKEYAGYKKRTWF